MNNLIIRKTEKGDAHSITSIYNYYILNSTVTFETEKISTKEMEKRIEQITQTYPFYTAILNDRIVGYAYSSQINPRAAYNWSTALSIYIDKEFTKLKIGSALYNTLEKDLINRGFHNLYAIITSPNPRSVSFHEKQGFKKVAHLNRCGFKHNKWMDVIWMEKFIKESSQAPTPINS